jgi:hypothetical protein
MAHMMRSFWECSECSLTFFNLIAGRLSSANSLWAEIIENFPNSIQFRDLSITYLIEPAMHDSEAVFQRSRANMIKQASASASIIASAASSRDIRTL